MEQYKFYGRKTKNKNSQEMIYFPCFQVYQPIHSNLEDDSKKMAFEFVEECIKGELEIPVSENFDTAEFIVNICVDDDKIVQNEFTKLRREINREINTTTISNPIKIENKAIEQETVDKGDKYWKSLKGVKDHKIDIYGVCETFSLNSACSHAIKKILMAGKRGYKDETNDIQEAITALQRHLELIKK